MIAGGEYGGRRVLPASWIEDIAVSGDPEAWAAGDFAAYLPGACYRSKWYVDDSSGPLLFALGIHGQYLFVDRERRLVIAKLSSQALPLDSEGIALTLLAVSTIRRTLSAP